MDFVRRINPLVTPIVAEEHGLAPLSRLPAEITEKIADLLSFNPVAEVWVPTGATAQDIESSMKAANAERTTKEDFCAFRLTCKDVYLKTFRLFGQRYFTKVSVGFTRVSLDRLRELTSYKNNFGLTLNEFPSDMVVSTHRLLPGSEVGRIFSASDPNGDAQSVVATINLLHEMDVECYNIPGTYDRNLYVVAAQYTKDAADQKSITTSDYDVDTIAQSLAAFPKFHSIALDAFDSSWGEKDWDVLAGFRVASDQPTSTYGLGLDWSLRKEPSD